MVHRSIFGGLDPVGRATRLLLVLQERADIRGEQSSFFRLCIVLGGVLPVVYLVYFEDSVSQSYRCLKFWSTPSPGHGSIFVRTPAEKWTLFFGAGLAQWEL